jgi:KaiC/GvpD/RAD55 family RecA-like ATPase
MTNVKAYNFIKLDELFDQSLEVDWLVEDIIPNNSIGMIYGASGSGKSHIVLSMAAMIASGLPWFDADTKQGNVLVMAGEGLSGISRRLKAIEKEHQIKIDRDKLHVSNRAIGLDTDSGYKLVEQAIQELGVTPQLIFIDTLSRHLMNSEENSNDDMARFIIRLEEIRIKHNCTVVLVHHTGKGEGHSARGASALEANVDFNFKVSGEGKKCTFTCKKMKDADDAIPIKNFEIRAVNLGQKSSKGKQITGACVVGSKASISLKVVRKSNEDVALACFNPDKKMWQKVYLEVCTDNVDEETKKRRYREARKQLIGAGKVIENDDGSYSINKAALDKSGRMDLP